MKQGLSEPRRRWRSRMIIFSFAVLFGAGIVVYRVLEGRPPGASIAVTVSPR